MKFLVFFILLTSIFFSCSSNKDELQEISNMQVKLTALEQSFSSIQTEELESAISAYHTNMNKIKTYYYSDTVDMNFVEIMSNYKIIKKISNSYDDNYSNIETNISLMAIQLENLKNDINNAVLPLDSLLFFISYERENLSQINSDLVNFIIDCDNIISIDDSISGKIVGLINAYSKP